VAFVLILSRRTNVAADSDRRLAFARRRSSPLNLAFDTDGERKFCPINEENIKKEKIKNRIIHIKIKIVKINNNLVFDKFKF